MSRLRTRARGEAKMARAVTAPNIIFIHVDELRFPTGFPAGMTCADEFMKTFMPWTYQQLWQDGARFTNHHTAAADCTPSRAAFVTGLYAHQTFMMCTRATLSSAESTSQPQPFLDPAFPTYGKLLRLAGYDTPYIGKWHLSDSPASVASSAINAYLEPYGFQGLSVPDPLGMPGQGVGVTLPAPPPVGSVAPLDDAQIATQAVTWLHQRASSGATRPFCLTVGFINPHDKQFFWGGTEATRFKAVYREQGGGEAAARRLSGHQCRSAQSAGFRLRLAHQLGVGIKPRRRAAQAALLGAIGFFLPDRGGVGRCIGHPVLDDAGAGGQGRADGGRTLFLLGEGVEHVHAGYTGR